VIDGYKKIYLIIGMSMANWTMDIIAPNGNCWGSAFGESAKELKFNAEGLLMKLESLEELTMRLEEEKKREER